MSVERTREMSDDEFYRTLWAMLGGLAIGAVICVGLYYVMPVVGDLLRDRD